MSTLSSSTIAPFQLLEINVIAAQDLAPVAKSIKAYAVAWLRPERKLATQIDEEGHTNPRWNEKFVFRVDEELLNSVVMIEIYNSSWIRDVLIGTVGVLVRNLLPPSANSGGNRKPKLRFVALQIRRPNGRPQGILNIGVALLDSTMRSMPIYSDLSSSGVGYSDLTDFTNQLPNPEEKAKNQTDYSEFMTLQRCQSEKNDSTINDYTYNGAGKQEYYAFDGQDSDVAFRKGGAMNDESLCSDVGPSPSVVAAAIAKGLYPMPAPPTAESSTVDGWSESTFTEGMKNKMERWRAELTPAYEVYDAEESEPKRSSSKPTPKRGGKTPGRGGKRGGGLFSCFGTAFGCEFSVTCGGKGGRKKKRGSRKVLTSVSEVTFDESSII